MFRFHRSSSRHTSPDHDGRSTLLWILAAAVLLLVAAVAWTPALAADADADEAPSVEVPDALDSGMATMGGHAYRSYCASCHGAEGEGDGSISTMLTVRPSDLTQLTAENDGEFPYERAYLIIDGRVKVKGHGTSDMPAWGDAFQEISESEEEVDKRIHQLVQFLWSIQD